MRTLRNFFVLLMCFIGVILTPLAHARQLIAYPNVPLLITSDMHMCVSDSKALEYFKRLEKNPAGVKMPGCGSLGPGDFIGIFSYLKTGYTHALEFDVLTVQVIRLYDDGNTINYGLFYTVGERQNRRSIENLISALRL